MGPILSQMTWHLKTLKGFRHGVGITSLTRGQKRIWRAKTRDSCPVRGPAAEAWIE